MSVYAQLLDAENRGCHTIDIREISTEKDGVANTCYDGKVAVFYGADDGSDDAVISPEEFNRRFEITGVIKN